MFGNEKGRGLGGRDQWAISSRCFHASINFQTINDSFLKVTVRMPKTSSNYFCMSFPEECHYINQKHKILKAASFNRSMAYMSYFSTEESHFLLSYYNIVPLKCNLTRTSI